jgi:hypothetical protein
MHAEKLGSALEANGKREKRVINSSCTEDDTKPF